MSFVGLVWSGTKQGEQKCLMYATVFHLETSEISSSRETPIYRTNRWRENNQVAEKMTIARNVR
jgi:hypothetical protein